MGDRFRSDDDNAENNPAAPSAFTDWMNEWEDVRSDEGDETAEVTHDVVEADTVDPSGFPSVEVPEPDEASDPPEPVEPARQTRDLPDLPAETPPDEMVRRRQPHVPSPPPVRPLSEPVAVSTPPVRPSRPRPVSAASISAPQKARTIGSSPPSVRVDPPGTVTGGVESRLAGQARQTTSRTIQLGGVDITVGATQRAMLVTVGAGLVLIAGMFAYLLSGLGNQTDSATREPDPDALVETQPPDLNVSASSPAAPSTSELAETTVRIAGLDESGESVCAGSGVLVGEEGVILTNAHVVTIDEDCPFTTIAVGVTLDTSEPPDLEFRAEVLVSDPDLDFAVIRIVGLLSSDDQLEIEPNFPTATLGDSDQVALGDNIRILGYPVIGGETITQTAGSVAGFVAEDAFGNRALIKTEASISAGNSGGMAVNDAGEVIGIPTKAGANGVGPPVDCRPVSDTNGDGQIAGDDVCMPIGGFLNSIRPINLARDLLARAEAMQRDAGRGTVASNPIDLTKVSIWNPRFSTGEENDTPVDEVITLTQGAEEICLFVDWSGIPNGVSWAAVWSHDGQQIEDFSIFKVWEYGEDGRNFWYCAEDRRGHPAGVYEVGLFINDELAFVESIEVTDRPVDTYEVMWVNKSDQDLCGLAINPLAASRHAGVNMLEPGDVMQPGESRSIELPAGDIVVEAYDCMGTAVAAELDGLTIPADIFVDGQQLPFVIGDSATISNSDE